MTHARFGRYELGERLAIGGMAEVYAARTHGAEGFVKDVVIKRILPAYNDDPDFIQMFINEARLAAKLQHTNIVQVFDFDHVDGVHYIAMERVTGVDLQQIHLAAAEKGQPIPQALTLLVGAEALMGLHYAHNKTDGGAPLELVHRDISPSNILVSYAGDVKIADFGIAKAAAFASVTGTGVVKGKIRYMSPEQLQGKPVDGRSDIFSLGLILWELLAQKPAYPDCPTAQLIGLVRRGDIASLAATNPNVPEALSSVIDKMLAANVDERYQSAADALADFSGLISTADALEVSAYLAKLFPVPHRAEAVLPPEFAPTQAVPAIGQPTELGVGPAAEPAEPAEPPVFGEFTAQDKTELTLATQPIQPVNTQMVLSEVADDVAPERTEDETMPVEHVAAPAVAHRKRATDRLRPARGIFWLDVVLSGAVAFLLCAGVTGWLSRRQVNTPDIEKIATAKVAVDGTSDGELFVDGIPLGHTKMPVLLAGFPDSSLSVELVRGLQRAHHRVALPSEQTLAMAFPEQTSALAFSVGDLGPQRELSGPTRQLLLATSQPQKSTQEVTKAPAPIAAAAVEGRLKPRTDAGVVARKRRDAGVKVAKRQPEAEFGFVHVVVWPWATVYIDDEMIGTTPIRRHRVKVGKHQLKIRNGAINKLEIIDVNIEANRGLRLKRRWTIEND